MYEYDANFFMRSTLENQMLLLSKKKMNISNIDCSFEEQHGAKIEIKFLSACFSVRYKQHIPQLGVSKY